MGGGLHIVLQVKFDCISVDVNHVLCCPFLFVNPVLKAKDAQRDSIYSIQCS